MVVVIIMVGARSVVCSSHSYLTYVELIKLAERCYNFDPFQSYAEVLYICSASTFQTLTSFICNDFPSCSGL
jgi:hypothetical protein